MSQPHRGNPNPRGFVGTVSLPVSEFEESVGSPPKAKTLGPTSGWIAETRATVLSRIDTAKQPDGQQQGGRAAGHQKCRRGKASRAADCRCHGAPGLLAAVSRRMKRPTLAHPVCGGKRVWLPADDAPNLCLRQKFWHAKTLSHTPTGSGFGSLASTARKSRTNTPPISICSASPGVMGTRFIC